MGKCVVAGCKETGHHKFPKEENLRKLWIEAIKRPDLHDTTSPSVRICRHHFTDNDFRTKKLSTSFNCVRKILTSDAVPSVFAWPKDSTPPKKTKNKVSKRSVKPPSPEVDPLDIDELPSPAKTPPIDIEKAAIEETSDVCTKSTQTPLLLRLFGAENLTFDDESVEFYTGLKNYEQFQYVFNTLYSAEEDREDDDVALNAVDQFLLTLTKLRCNKCDFELHKMFGVSKSEVSRIFLSWINVMYAVWSDLDIPLHPDLIDYCKEDGENETIIIDSVKGTKVYGKRTSTKSPEKLSKNRDEIKRLISKSYKFLELEMNFADERKILFVCAVLCYFRMERISNIAII